MFTGSSLYVSDVPSKPISASMFEWWNVTSKTTEILCVVALNTPITNLSWYRFHSEMLVKLFIFVINLFI